MSETLAHARGIALIGPMSAGKSTVGKLLAAGAGVEAIELDDLRWRYYDEIDFDREHANAMIEAGNIRGVFDYSKPFEAHAVERAVVEHAGKVLSFGAGHSVHTDPVLQTRVRQALLGWHVVLLLPSSDDAVSERVLLERLRQIPEFPLDVGSAMNHEFITSPANRDLATVVAYTDNTTPEETAKVLSIALKSAPISQ